MKKCPDEYLGRWFSILHRLYMTHIAQGLQEYQIGSGQIMFLLELYFADGVRQEDLSALLNIDGANTTRAIRKLESEGYVKRKPDPNDKRARRIFLTEKAELIKPSIFSLIQGWEEQLVSSLSEPEQKLFLELLQKMGKSVAEYDRCLFCHQLDDCQ